MFIGIFLNGEATKQKKKVEEKIYSEACTYTPDNLYYYFPSLPLSFRLPFSLSLSCSLAFSLSLFSILSFSFDNTNIDSIGDNKLYYCLMNARARACVRSNLSRQRREGKKERRKERKKNSIQSGQISVKNQLNSKLFIRYLLERFLTVHCHEFSTTNYHLLIKFIHAKHDHHRIRQTKSPISSRSCQLKILI